MQLSNVLNAYQSSSAAAADEIVAMSPEQIEMVEGATGSGWVYSTSGECNASGRDCNFVASFIRFLATPFG